MGQVSPTSAREIRFDVFDAKGEKVALLNIMVRHLHAEVMGELANPELPSGPENRKIVSTFDGASARVTFLSKEEHPQQKKLVGIAASLEKDGGLKTQNSEDVISFDATSFGTELKAYVLEKTGLNIERK